MSVAQTAIAPTTAIPSSTEQKRFQRSALNILSTGSLKTGTSRIRTVRNLLRQDYEECGAQYVIALADYLKVSHCNNYSHPVTRCSQPKEMPKEMPCANGGIWCLRNNPRLRWSIIKRQKLRFQGVGGVLWAVLTNLFASFLTWRGQHRRNWNRL